MDLPITEIAGELTISPQISFASTSRQFCREFSVSGPSADLSAVACRIASGWDIVQMTGRTLATEGQFKTATAGLDSNYDTAVEGMISRLILADQEQALIDSQWQPK